MTNFVLLTAMPPTTGHRDLIRFAAEFGYGRTVVVLCTQPDEPIVDLRVNVVRGLCEEASLNSLNNVSFRHIHRTMPQNESEYSRFWEMWRDILVESGYKEGDVIIASEAYGQKLVDVAGGTFIPFDIDRQINPAKATGFRTDIYARWDELLPQVKQKFQKRVTIWGAESVGKTTLSKQLAEFHDWAWRFEYARPYLETVGAELDRQKMMNIFNGQLATQRIPSDKMVIVQDTDLFSTIGYWNLHEDVYGLMPNVLLNEALATVSDLYIIPLSNIPFEEDPLRYGGKVREGSDDYWVSLAEEFNLPYITLVASDHAQRMYEAETLIVDLIEDDEDAKYLREYVRK